MHTSHHLHLAVVRHIIIFIGHLAMDYSPQLVLLFVLSLTVMLIGPDVLILDGLSQVGAYFLVIL